MRLWIDTSRVGADRALFGLHPVQRIRRSAGAVAVTLSGPGAAACDWPGATIDDAAAPCGTRLARALAGSETLVALDAADAIDPRLVAALLRPGGSVVAARGSDDARAVALRLAPGTAVDAGAHDLAAVAAALGATPAFDERDVPAYVDKLRRVLPYWIHAVPDAGAARRVERTLFWSNYKGSTDLLTRWVYPPLVWPLVRFSTRFGIHPNAITVLSVVLAFAAVPLWAGGHWLAGFVCAYAMSVLDSVDGKVARLTLTDTKVGDVLDHGLDIVHPPFWYWSWAVGLGAARGDALYATMLWMLAFYVADRIVLGIARRRLGHALHSATPLDARVRSVIARRNITMTIMAAAVALGAGAAGFVAVTVWQGLTCAWHGWRTLRLTPKKRPMEAR